MEYEWAVYVDVDNDRATGANGPPLLVGADYSVSARYFVRDPGATVTAPIERMLQANVWKHEGPNFSMVTTATFQADPEAEALVLIGEIPGIMLESRVFFQTIDYNPGGMPISDT